MCAGGARDRLRLPSVQGAFSLWWLNRAAAKARGAAQEVEMQEGLTNRAAVLLLYEAVG